MTRERLNVADEKYKRKYYSSAATAPLCLFVVYKFTIKTGNDILINKYHSALSFSKLHKIIAIQ